MAGKKKLCFLSTVEFAVDVFLFNHLKELSKFYKITVITNRKNKSSSTKISKDINVINVNFSRKINLLNDLICLFQLIGIFLKTRFDVVTTITPKAGLLGMLASFLTFIPMRVHCFTGQVWAVKKGLKRIFFKFFDKLINYFSTHNIVDSKSQFSFLLNEKVISKKNSFVFGKGSICGVDLLNFRPNKKARSAVRKKFKIPDSAFIFLFVGRLNKDKGIYDLIDAFKKAKLESAFLMLVGPDEENISIKFQHCKNIFMHDFSASPQNFMASCDLLCLPSYREGFGNVVIEAAAVGVPAMISDIYGLCDAVVPNKTGIVHNVGDINHMVEMLKLMCEDKLLLKNLGNAARIRAKNEFDANLITKHWQSFYKTEISKFN